MSKPIFTAEEKAWMKIYGTRFVYKSKAYKKPSKPYKSTYTSRDKRKEIRPSVNFRAGDLLNKYQLELLQDMITEALNAGEDLITSGSCDTYENHWDGSLDIDVSIGEPLTAIVKKGSFNEGAYEKAKAKYEEDLIAYKAALKGLADADTGRKLAQYEKLKDELGF